MIIPMLCVTIFVILVVWFLLPRVARLIIFFFNDTATTEIYTLSLHDALPIFQQSSVPAPYNKRRIPVGMVGRNRSEEHTSELQSHVNLVCRLLLEKKKRWLTTD